ncbi:MAG: SMC-Scp complex subunit ScpB [Candidatus Aenigmatarchaeota archaeon]
MATQSDPQKLAVLEAVLFSTSKPLKIEEIAKISKIRKDQIEPLLKELRKRYVVPESGLRLFDVGGYRLMVKQEFLEKVSSLAKADLSKGLLRVLALIAYHEPIKQCDIVKVIGNRTYEYMKVLENLGFVKSEKKGRTKLLRTTPQFENYFGTKREELKKLVKESGTDNKQIEQQPTQPENSPKTKNTTSLQ